ncbi:sugar ABC transporter ATP-binding protein [Aminobacter aminovorans]|uniref:ABC-type sugar transport system ATPase subunit n=1 Tax=Aminobacter aminovorans TaxID=83263 RepID=A0AAC8YRK6_AMIAI|nr:sugar ABC transporter ATP-binding protein [Aminobacter aminovorans]AMS42879.1 putative MglA, ABC-type sugar transport system, ATPase component MglA [Aminobacter aminovorans]MBB3704728.1 ABC-type sugar transport system ATPase subunit [Aminobacter aminovorans]
MDTLAHSNSAAMSQASTGVGAPLLVATNVSKSFGGVLAVNNVSFELKAGEVHGLVGANGAGKSTFTRILAGAEIADAGTIRRDGRDIAPATPREGRLEGIAAIYQELSLVPERSALSNVFIGNLLHKGPFLDISAMRKRYAEINAWMGVNIPPHAVARSLSIADQQMLEIMRAMQGRNAVLVMDEPSAPLGPKERAKLHALIAQLAGMGTGIIFISHDLDEVLTHCDRVSVMRDAQLIDTRPASEWSKASLVTAMLGQASVAEGTVRSHYGSDVLSADNVSVTGRVFNASFSVQAGEILGIAGLVGAGRTELLCALAGAEPRASGRVKVEGKTHSLPASLQQAISSGIALVPEDRKRHGLILSRSSLSNITLPNLKTLSRFSFLKRSKQRQSGESLSQAVGFSPSRITAVSGKLSGGNQQKLVIGKWLYRRPRVFLLDEPTRGVDVGAKHEIYHAIRQIANDGAAIILVSSDLDEVVTNADRILVLARGRIVGELDRAEASVERILKLVFGVTGEQASE